MIANESEITKNDDTVIKFQQSFLFTSLKKICDSNIEYYVIGIIISKINFMLQLQVLMSDK